MWGLKGNTLTVKLNSALAAAGMWDLKRNTLKVKFNSAPHAAKMWDLKGNTSISSPITGLEWPRGFQEDKVPRFHDNGTGW